MHDVREQPDLLDAEALPRRARRRRILVAATDRDLRLRLYRTLTLEGYDVVLASSGGELLGRFAEIIRAQGERLPDLIITGADPSGLESVAALRSSDWTTPVIFLRPRPCDPKAPPDAEAHRLEAAAVLDAPVTPVELKSLQHAVHDILRPW